MKTKTQEYKPPYPYFGGKRAVACEVWQRFGRVTRYIEPFLGGGAVWLANPWWRECREVVNDKDHFIVNFWRAMKAEPDTLAHIADYPSTEADLVATSNWLATEGESRLTKIIHDIHFYDAEVAARWVWGMSNWIGGGFAEYECKRKRPDLSYHGIRSKNFCDLFCAFRRLAERTRNTVVFCGDWMRCLTPAVLGLRKQQTAAIFLDPPYSHDVGRDNDIYRHESENVAKRVAEWCRANGDNPQLRIALCGYDSEHDLPGWTVFRWKAQGGMSHLGKEQNPNRFRETIWFSPHCLKAELI